MLFVVIYYTMNSLTIIKSVFIESIHINVENEEVFIFMDH